MSCFPWPITLLTIVFVVAAKAHTNTAKNAKIFVMIYGQGNDFVQDAIPVVRIVSSALVIMSFSTVWLNAVTGTGNSTVTLLIETIAIVLYSIYIYLVLEVYKLPITIGWMSEWLYWSVLFLASYIYIKGGKWRKKVI